MSEVVIIGGGLTGLMMANALSHTGLHSDKSLSGAITLIDRAESDAEMPDERTTTINAAGARMLQALGVWDRLAMPPSPIMRIEVAEGAPATGLAARQRRPHDLSWEAGDKPMGFVVENADLQAALRSALKDRAGLNDSSGDDAVNRSGITEIRKAEVRAFTTQTDGTGRANLTFAGGLNRDDQNRERQISANLVVACDGARSLLADLAGLPLREERQYQTAIVSTLRAEKHHGNTAYQRFLPTGPFALMPLQGNDLSLVWTLPNAKAEALIEADIPTFEAACFEAFGQQLGYLQLVGNRLSWPLHPAIRPQITAPGLILAGDAAHAIHPLAGQGYNLALADAAILADLLLAAKQRGLPASHPSIRGEYETRRKSERLGMSFATSGLNHLFARAPSPVRRAAGATFTLMDRLPMKSIFSDIAEGGQLADAALLRGELPGDHLKNRKF